jgi:chemotaxis protein CheX
MQGEELSQILSGAVRDVFQTMLGTDLEIFDAYADLSPFVESEVTGFIPLTGSMTGYVSIHASREQCRDFTARLIGCDLEEIESDADIGDAVGEIANMIAGSVKSGLVSTGAIEIALPTVSLTPKASLRVQGGSGWVVPVADYTGEFQVEIVVGTEGRVIQR